MSITPNDFRNGLVFERQNELYQVMEFQHIKPGKGPAFVRVKLKNLKNGAIFEEKLRPEEKLDEVRIEARKMNFLYFEGDNLVLMDNETYDQVHVPKEMLGKQVQLIATDVQSATVPGAGHWLMEEAPGFVIPKLVEGLLGAALVTPAVAREL